MKIGDLVVDLFGRKCKILELKDSRDSDGNPAVSAHLETVSPGDMWAQFWQNIALLKPAN